ncbi:hypothetical protein CROQUDRAFT_132557 [Cronartium quercuum f. sp. fusiforme G11]|uniref:Secreted protein n=1 Tax=Cronartium quercuum f. sp. fusiforme G11 TaxID=708437 RepID=A0A9P6TCK5_9BASI|nr:hypothetical protein CROQUDRAFT_132557 [Cronartium quercuum f. sp. fusiforme G11]
MLGTNVLFGVLLAVVSSKAVNSSYTGPYVVCSGSSTVGWVSSEDSMNPNLFYKDNSSAFNEITAQSIGICYCSQVSSAAWFLFCASGIDTRGRLEGTTTQALQFNSTFPARCYNQPQCPLPSEPRVAATAGTLVCMDGHSIGLIDNKKNYKPDATSSASGFDCSCQQPINSADKSLLTCQTYPPNISPDQKSAYCGKVGLGCTLNPQS